MGGVLESSSDLFRLINQILDLSRVEAGKIELSPSRSTCRRGRRRRQRGRGDGPRPALQVRLMCPPERRVQTDPSKLQQFLTNLVANSVKFTVQGQVDVAVTEDAGRDLVGSPSRHRHRHPQGAPGFEEFRQVDGSSRGASAAPASGLAIAKRLAQMLGATIDVESVFGVGSCFTLRLPRSPLLSLKQRSRSDTDSNPVIAPPPPTLPVQSGVSE